MEFTQQIIIGLSLIVLTFILIYTFLNRKVLGAYPLLIQTIVTIIWTLASLFEIQSYSIESKIFWRNIQQIGIFIGPITNLFFVIDYTKQTKLKKYAYAIGIIPIIALTLIFTDKYHHIMRLSIEIAQSDFFGRTLLVNSTVIGKSFVTYNFWIPIISIVILFDFMNRVSKYYKKRVLLVIVSLVWILVASWIKGGYLQTNGYYIPGAVFFTPTYFILFYSLFRYKFFSLSPIARDKVFDVINEGIVVVDLYNNIVDINSSCINILKRCFNIDKEFIGSSIVSIFSESPEITDLILIGNKSNSEIEIKDNQNCYLSFKVYPLTSGDYEKIGLVIIIEDITEYKNYELYLKEKASKDSLTGLLNRSGFKNEFHKISNNEYSLSILMLDIDKFKNINDTYGHLNGDKVLVHLAKALEKEINNKGFVGRLGGEEFAIILPGMDKYNAFDIAEKIRKDIEKSTVIIQDDKYITYTVSIGISDGVGNNKNLDELLHNADMALYEAKKKSRNCTVIY